jgi:hypothetical protein
MNTDRLYRDLGRILSKFERSSQRVSQYSPANPLLILYSMEVSPYCRKVIRALDRNKIGIEIKDVLESETAFHELMVGGKIDQVPCLRIRMTLQSQEQEDQWLYESEEIISYFKKNHSKNGGWK